MPTWSADTYSIIPVEAGEGLEGHQDQHCLPEITQHTREGMGFHPLLATPNDGAFLMCYFSFLSSSASHCKSASSDQITFLKSQPALQQRTNSWLVTERGRSRSATVVRNWSNEQWVLREALLKWSKSQSLQIFYLWKGNILQCSLIQYLPVRCRQF